VNMVFTSKGSADGGDASVNGSACQLFLDCCKRDAMAVWWGAGAARATRQAELYITCALTVGDFLGMQWNLGDMLPQVHRKYLVDAFLWLQNYQPWSWSHSRLEGKNGLCLDSRMTKGETGWACLLSILVAHREIRNLRRLLYVPTCQLLY
jgi:hypothetical protein